MQPGCSLCSLAVCRRPGAASGAASGEDQGDWARRSTYLETRRASTWRSRRLGDALRGWLATWPPWPLGRQRVASSITPTTTTTTISATSPPDGRTPTTPLEERAQTFPLEERTPTSPVEERTPSVEDRAFLDFDTTTTTPRQSRRCGAFGCGVFGCGSWRGCSGRLSWIRELEGRCCAVLAILTFMSMVVGLALFSDPLLLNMSTQLRRADCVTLNFTLLFGATNCSWSSCRESCTSPSFKCVQIFVNYTLLEVPEELDEEAGTVPLQVTVPGCGLDVVKYSCDKFNNEYLAAGRRFPCEVAWRAERSLAVPMDIQEAVGTVPPWVPSLVPVMLCALCVVYIRARRLFTIEPVEAPVKKRQSLRPRNETRSFYKRKMQEMDEWRRLRRQLMLTGPAGSSRTSSHQDSDQLVSDGDLEDVVVGTVVIEPHQDDDDNDVEVEWPPPPAPRSPPEPPPPPPASPATSPTEEMVPMMVSDDGTEGALRTIPEEMQLVSGSPRGVSSGSSSWRGQPLPRNIQTVSCTIDHQRPFDISQ